MGQTNNTTPIGGCAAAGQRSRPTQDLSAKCTSTSAALPLCFVRASTVRPCGHLAHLSNLDQPLNVNAHRGKRDAGAREIMAAVLCGDGDGVGGGSSVPGALLHMAGTSPVLFFSLLFERGGAVVARFVCGCLACLGENTCENCQSAGGCWLRLCAETEMAVSLRNPVCWRSRGVVGCRCR